MAAIAKKRWWHRNKLYENIQPKQISDEELIRQGGSEAENIVFLLNEFKQLKEDLVWQKEQYAQLKLRLRLQKL